jgi:hypothetical protein
MNMAGARVCSDDEKSYGEEEVRDLGFIPAVENVFIAVPGRRLSSSASRRRRLIGRCPVLHRAASQLEVEDDEPVHRPAASGSV